MIQYHERAPFECVWLNKNKTEQKKNPTKMTMKPSFYM